MSAGTSANSVCVPPGKNPKAWFVNADYADDGPCGIDNAWGHLNSESNLAHLSSAEQTAVAKSGAWTLLVAVDGLSSGAQGGLTVRLYTAAPRSSPPAFDGSDIWSPVTWAGGGSVLASPATWPAAYVTDDVLVATAPTQVFVSLRRSMAGAYPMWLQNAALVLRLSPDRSRVVWGFLAGIMTAGQLVADLCPSLNPPEKQLFGDVPIPPGAALCSGVSVAIGLTAGRASLGDPTTMPQPQPCQK